MLEGERRADAAIKRLLFESANARDAHTVLATMQQLRADEPVQDSISGDFFTTIWVLGYERGGNWENPGRARLAGRRAGQTLILRALAKNS